MDAGIIVGTVGALAGVALGSWITALSQRNLAREAQTQAAIRARELAYVEYLAAIRSFRRFLLTEPVAVRVIERAKGRKTPVIAESAKYWDRFEAASSHVYIIATDRPVLAFAQDVRKAFYQVAEARGTYGPGAVPDAIISVARDAENAFARAAHDDLQSK